ncbi:LysR family transcriptional regulator [uncultured Hydrogenophaga sp.]|uniref:LysR family transcriptional regulator n=1 Tax=uncultured Hydrogenophaga sp. TaxID=199683 RepID=UPI00265DC60C|nr:LysR family transcriptional regulator [uncultured Hydrogenophaga sp.]
MNLSFRQLRVFLEVAQRGGVTAAANALHLTPPAVSMQIKELENQVGLQLFDRNGRTLVLSTAGEYFVVHAKRMLGALRDADNAMARFKKLEHGLLTVGMVSTAKYFVPRLLALFRQEHPGIEVRLTVANNRESLLTQMDAGQIDLSIMGRPPPELSTRSEAFAAHPLVFVAPPGHPLMRIGHPPLKALTGYPFIVREQGSGTRSAMESFFAEQRFEPQITMEMSSNEAIKQAVMADMGISFLSLHTIGLELRMGLLKRIDVEGTPIMRTWHVVHLQSKVLSPAAEAFRYFVIERGEDMLVEHDTPLLSG